ncbi:MAG: hypothetical protein LBC56_02275 [Oscillospiraceae bacterium]|jgi:hypothetical protein|nr:hypothetical protein [Oscillospiraceae bacterium]
MKNKYMRAAALIPAVAALLGASFAAGASRMAMANAREGENKPPYVSGSAYFTLENNSFSGCVKAADPEGGALSVYVVVPPKKGRVEFNGVTFVYTPYTGQTGTDSFVFCAADSMGALSREGTAEIKIQSPGKSREFDDMKDNAYCYSALKASEKQIISGEKIGRALLFYPEKQVSGGEFLLMLSAAADLKPEDASCINTGLVNDSGLRLWTKPYIDTGLKNGLITEKYFDFEGIVTRAEAVKMADRALGMGDVSKSAVYIRDLSSVPEDALQSYLNLSAYDVLNLYDGCAHPSAALTRDFAADLAYRIYLLKH